MALQPATRRLLTEAAADTTYQPKGSYQPAGSYLTTTTYAADKGAPSGIATLGADGKVPAGQLPPASLVSFAAAKAADTTRTTNILAADPDLTFAGVPAGTYEVTYHCAFRSTAASQSLQHSLVVSAGVLTGALIYAGSAASTPAGQSLSGNGSASYTLPSHGTGGTANFLAVVTYRGTLNLSAAATFSLNWAQAGGTTITLAAGSGLRLVKIG